MDLPKLIVFDFDGVLTDNRVLVFSDGREAVFCDRADGLAFDMLRLARVKCLILSTELNPVVRARARKLKVPVIHGLSDKASTLRLYCKKEKISLKDVLYVGNDLNDYDAMILAGRTACPADSHAAIKKISTIKLRKNGGRGAVRELCEKHLDLRRFSFKA